VRLVVELSSDRSDCGTLMVCSKRGGRLCGPFPVAARATDPLAAAAGNPKRNPLLRYGDTPTGGYIVTRLLKSGRGTRFPTVQFGANGVIVLEPVSGAAAAAEANGRFHFLIAGGRLSREGCLRSTAGGLRLTDDHLRALFSALQGNSEIYAEITEREGLRSSCNVFVDGLCRHQDPQPLNSLHRAWRSGKVARDMLRGGMAGAMVFGFSVSFIASSVEQAGASSESGSSVTAERRNKAALGKPAALAIVKPHGVYVKMAYGGRVPSSQSNTAPDMNAVVNYIDENAGDTSSGTCALACRKALEAGGMNTSDRPEDDKDYGPFLERHGAKSVAPENYQPQKGDIAVFAGNPSHPHGHVQIYDGKEWVSDFKQSKFSPYSNKTTPPSKIYRF
jgi:hypothetical protein